MKENEHTTPIGDILVHRGEPPQSNPYRGLGRETGEPVTHVQGQPRSEALGKFLRGLDVPGFTFWYAPTMGGSKRYDKPPRVHPDMLDYYWEADGTPKRKKK